MCELAKAGRNKRAHERLEQMAQGRDPRQDRGKLVLARAFQRGEGVTALLTRH